MIVVDLDGTLIASPRVEGNDFAAWESSIIASPPPPVPGAIEGVRQAIDRFGGDVVLITARSERLRKVTTEWLFHYAPRAVYRALSMGLDGPDSGGRVHKAIRLARIVESAQSPIHLFDDDEEMRHALRHGDTFLHAPGCWK